jgi:hypothetical protein
MMERPSPRELRGFGLGVGSILLGLALLAWRAWFPFGESHPRAAAGLAGLGGALAALGVVRPRLLAAVHAAWMRVVAPIGWFNTRLLLGVVYYLVLLPTGLIRRLGVDPLDMRGPPRPSYWVKRPPGGDPETYRRQS